jgi:Mg-chelatase subunit ChlD
MRRFPCVALLACLAAIPAAAARAGMGEIQVEIAAPADGHVFADLQDSTLVEGGASIFGGVRHLDLFFVLDSSKSLRRSDRRDQRTAGAVALVRALPAKSDIHMGVVDVDGNAELVAPLTGDRNAVVAALQGLDQLGSTDLAAGIRTALAGFRERGRPGSSRVILLFTDGKSDEEEARAATHEAQREGVAIHTLVLGSDRKGAEMLSAIAETTGGSFVRVSDPSRLAQAFLDLRTTGIERVVLHVGDSPPIPATLIGGHFSARVPLAPGANRIVATATSLDGRTRDAVASVVVSGPLLVAIDDPLDGALLAGREAQVAVRGSATAFAGLAPEIASAQPDRGVRQVSLRVGEAGPYPTTLLEGRFEGMVPLTPGENRILATATSVDGRSSDHAVLVTLRAAGCAGLEVRALRDGHPTLSLDERAVEIVFDASGSMWAQIDGRSKMEIARQTLGDALEALPADLHVGLRVYGHQRAREAHDCRDSELLVPPAAGQRDRIREAIASFKPRGQTPLGYSLEQVTGDLSGFQGERAVVLVTDGIESCGGDPVAAARSLREGMGAPVHVIGFGLPGSGEEDTASLRAIAEASSGIFVAARNADELRDALRVTVGTPFRVSQAGRTLASGALGDDETIHLPAGAYALHLESLPPREFAFELAAEEQLTLTLERNAGEVTSREARGGTEWMACEESGAELPAAPAAAPETPVSD